MIATNKTKKLLQLKIRPMQPQFFFTIFDIVFDFWPALILAPLQYRKGGFQNVVNAWGFWAIIRVVLSFSQEPLPSLLIPEPLSTQLFFLTGFILIALWIGMEYLKRKRT